MQRYMLGFSVVLAFSLPPLAAAQEPAEATPAVQTTTSQAERIEAAIAAYDEAYDVFMKAYRAAESEEDSNRAIEELLPDSSAVAVELMAAARLDLTTPAAAQALSWMIEKRMGPERADALALLAEHHPTADSSKALLARLSRSADAASERFAQALLEHSSEPADRGRAHMALGKILSERHALARQLLENDGDSGGLFLGTLEPELLERLRALDAEGLAALQEAAFAHFQAILDDEAMAAVSSGRRTLGEEAASVMFEARFLTIGKTAPDIAGVDSAEVEFQLSDYRGQVVLLDFWGDW
jgi:hypothetical protein